MSLRRKLSKKGEKLAYKGSAEATKLFAILPVLGLGKDMQDEFLSITQLMKTEYADIYARVTKVPKTRTQIKAAGFNEKDKNSVRLAVGSDDGYTHHLLPVWLRNRLHDTSKPDITFESKDSAFQGTEEFLDSNGNSIIIVESPYGNQSWAHKLMVRQSPVTLWKTEDNKMEVFKTDTDKEVAKSFKEITEQRVAQKYSTKVGIKENKNILVEKAKEWAKIDKLLNVNWANFFTDKGVQFTTVNKEDFTVGTKDRITGKPTWMSK